jgi:ubiquinol-cytochrome c reductase cytochrome c1 subunit
MRSRTPMRRGRIAAALIAVPFAAGLAWELPAWAEDATKPAATEATPPGAKPETAAPAAAASPVTETPEAPSQKWSFGGLFGGLDLAAAQRGFQVYNEVCSACHSMNLLHYRDLAGIGLNADQIKAIAATKEVAGPLNDNGEPTTRPGLPSDTFKAPFPNDKAAQAANGGAIPPDQTLLVNARENGPNYIYAMVALGYVDPPAGFKVQDGLYYNTYFPGHQIHMPNPLSEGQVTYADGTKATVPQMTHDVVTFLTWASNPEAVQRKRMGVRAVLFFALLAGLAYAVKREVWKDEHH